MIRFRALLTVGLLVQPVPAISAPIRPDQVDIDATNAHCRAQITRIGVYVSNKELGRPLVVDPVITAKGAIQSCTQSADNMRLGFDPNASRGCQMLVGLAISWSYTTLKAMKAPLEEGEAYNYRVDGRKIVADLNACDS